MMHALIRALRGVIMQIAPDGNLYDIVLRIMIVPVVVGLLILSWVILSRLMSAEWQRKKRGKQIQKAAAAHQGLLAKVIAEEAARARSRAESASPAPRIETKQSEPEPQIQQTGHHSP